MTTAAITRLPGRRVGFGWPSPILRTGFGAVDLTDVNLNAAAQALYSNLQANGCQVAVVPEVRAFQQAWINAGGTLPNDTGGRSPIDGFYGANTATALQQIVPSAPAGCVGAAPSGGGAVTAITPTTTSGTSLNLPLTGQISALFASVMSGGTWTWVALGVLGLVGLAAWQHHPANVHRTASHPRRRRRPKRAHARRARRGRKARRRGRRRSRRR